jgi:hypothetical protein
MAYCYLTQGSSFLTQVAEVPQNSIPTFYSSLGGKIARHTKPFPSLPSPCSTREFNGSPHNALPLLLPSHSSHANKRRATFPRGMSCLCRFPSAPEPHPIAYTLHSRHQTFGIDLEPVVTEPHPLRGMAPHNCFLRSQASSSKILAVRKEHGYKESV